MSKLFSPFQLRGITFKNRIFVSPMCQYSCQNGMPTDWHLVHLGSRAVGGAALVMAEATAVSPEGCISPHDTGIWSEDHIEPFAHIARFIKTQNAVLAIQLAHAGRKASTDVPWRKNTVLSEAEGGWQPIAPSPVPFAEGSPAPQAMTPSMIEAVLQQFVEAARRSLAAGFEVIEIHMAHGYLLHEFLSPFSNHRTDAYGGDFAARTRFPLQVAAAIRKEAGIATGAVGLITEAKQAEQILANGEADVVLLARELLRDPYWPLHAAQELGVAVPWPVQYERARL